MTSTYVINLTNMTAYCNFDFLSHNDLSHSLDFLCHNLNFKHIIMTKFHDGLSSILSYVASKEDWQRLSAKWCVDIPIVLYLPFTPEIIPHQILAASGVIRTRNMWGLIPANNIIDLFLFSMHYTLQNEGP